MSAVAMTQATPSRAQRARPAGCVGGPPGNISRQDAMAPAALILRLTPPSPRLSPDARRRTHRARDASTTAPAHVARRAPNRGVLAFPRDARRITTAGAIAEPETVEVEVEESSPSPLRAPLRRILHRFRPRSLRDGNDEENQGEEGVPPDH